MRHACLSSTSKDWVKMFSPTTICVSGLFTAWYLWSRNLQKDKLPLGPPRLPITGNLHQAPEEAVWVTYRKWVEEYGPLVYLDFGGTSVILIGDQETAKDLLDKKQTYIVVGHAW